MTRMTFRRLAQGLLVAPIALALAACGGGDKGESALSGDPIAKVAPPAGKSWSEVIEKTPEGGYRIGNPEAPIKVIEFGALSCSHCAEFSEMSAAELREKFIDSGRVSFETRLFMLNALDIPAALLVTCGPVETVPALAEQFWAWQPAMFQKLQSAPQAEMQAIEAQQPPARFVSLARVAGMTEFVNARGISADQAAACLTDEKKVADLVAQTEKATKDFNVTGTPTFVVNGAKGETMNWPEMKAKLETMGAR